MNADLIRPSFTLAAATAWKAIVLTDSELSVGS